MGTGKIIFIRADANSCIASGHIMRCLTIAEALREKGNDVTFLVSDLDSISMLKSRGEEQIICLNSSWDKLDEELPQVCDIIEKHHVDILLLDTYSATSHYMATIRKICKLVYMDDLQAFSYPADLIINYDLVVDGSFYQNTPVLLGSSFTPLRKQFQSVTYSVNEKISSVLITTGGSDQYHTSSNIVTAMKNYDFYKQPKLTIHILVGKMSGDKDVLQLLAKKDDRIQLHENITDMASLLATCDLAFSAGGTTLFELCAVGVPTISFSISDVQFDCVHAFDYTGIIPYAGDVRNGTSFYNNLLKMGIKIAENLNLRKETSAKMRQFIDGNGAMRIADAIMTLL